MGICHGAAVRKVHGNGGVGRSDMCTRSIEETHEMTSGAGVEDGGG